MPLIMWHRQHQSDLNVSARNGKLKRSWKADLLFIAQDSEREPVFQ